MASTVKYKDLTTGDIVTVSHDPNYPVTITVPNESTPWTLVTTDPGGSLETDHEGRRPKK